jgi:hypothetical protein
LLAAGRGESGLSAICLSAMSDTRNHDLPLGIIDDVQDALVADA